MPEDFQELQTSTLEHSVIFGKFKCTRTKRLLTIQKALGRFSLKKKKLLNYQGLVSRKGDKFPRVKIPKISFKRVCMCMRAHAQAHTHLFSLTYTCVCVCDHLKVYYS